MNHSLSHLRITVNTLNIAIPFLLNLSRLDNPLTNRGTRFTRLHLCQFLKRHNRYLAVKINPIQ